MTLRFTWIAGFLFTGISILYSCRDSAKPDLIAGIEAPAIVSGENSNYHPRFAAQLENEEPPLAAVIDTIAMENTLEGEFVGMGAPSRQYPRYLFLKKYASITKLRELLQHTNAVVRMYAFQALEENKIPDLKLVLISRLQDTMSYHSQAGCFGSQENINISLLRRYSELFTPGEMVKYKKVLLTCYPKKEDAYTRKRIRAIGTENDSWLY